MPLASFLDVVTVHLRLIATSVATALLQGSGADIVRTGTMISSSDGSFAIDVASPCSGLRSLFALLALSAGYSYFALPTWPRRMLLFVLSVPIAILGNVVRILSICIVGSVASASFATGFYHDYSGYVIFAVSILLMLLTANILGRGLRK
jgi:exosortase